MPNKTKATKSKPAAKAATTKTSKTKTPMYREPRASAAKPKRRAKTTHKLTWQHVTCRVHHTPDYINQGWDHIELIVLTPKGAPVPITSTGYLSHFLDAEELAAKGGPVAFFTAWPL